MKKIIFIALFLCLPNFSNAEIITGTEVSVHFESANIIGSGRNINMHRVPIIDTSSGTTTYMDVSFKFTYDLSEGLIFEKISSINISPALSSSNLIPGEYYDEGGYHYSLSQPSSLSDGRLLYILRGIRDNQYSATNSISVVTGEAEGHPDIGDREIVPSLSPTYIYGIITDETGGNGNFATTGKRWLENQLIGVRQAGETLSVTLFSEGYDSNNNIQDYNSQRAAAVLYRVVAD